ncbi:aldo/keto reductase family oxidoreductase [Geothrix sp. PMB-07]|uniref:aldo/keto reductase n=1 Tax=Geothrix sp. PMB-07 TaxID=3068640 RepID=UPI0027426965|nr:aldo/keto reductase [Geothrix sp. PMB-07]WLT31020.1 aldo/keto reductase [Geothrix sp. PMB-07]
MNGHDTSLIQGLWRIGAWGLSSTELARLVEGCLDLGIDTFDLADIYHGYQCEALFGEALKAAPSLKARIRVISKCGIALVKPARPHHRVQHYNTSHAHIVASVEQSLAAMGLEQLDLLLIHRPDPLMDADEVARAFGDLHRAGKVAAFGVSNFLPHQFELLQSRLEQPLATNQVEVSLLRTDSLFDGTLDQAQRLRVRPQAWSPLGGGRLSREPVESALGQALAQVGRELDATPEQLALAWLLHHPAGIQPVLGSGKLERIRVMARARDLNLDRQQWFQLLEAARGFPVP